jgi:RNA 3'-terminal phosphate cyclase (ATP)
VGSTEIEFHPRRVVPGDYHFAIGTAGSTSLVFQTVLPPLLIAQGRSRVTFEGGTHNTGAPPYDFIAKAFVPLINRMGAVVQVSLERPGFAPAGGGKWVVDIDGGRTLQPIVLHDRGAVKARSVRALLSNLPEHVGERELAVARERLGWPAGEYRIEQVDAAGPGNVMLIEVRCANLTEVFVGFGQRGLAAEKVAADAVDCALSYLTTASAVGEYLADQLMLPLALAGGGSYTTLRPTLHATTNAKVISKFLPVSFDFNMDGRICNITINKF